MGQRHLRDPGPVPDGAAGAGRLPDPDHRDPHRRRGRRAQRRPDPAVGARRSPVRRLATRAAPISAGSSTAILCDAGREPDSLVGRVRAPGLPVDRPLDPSCVRSGGRRPWSRPPAIYYCFPAPVPARRRPDRYRSPHDSWDDTLALPRPPAETRGSGRRTLGGIAWRAASPDRAGDAGRGPQPGFVRPGRTRWRDHRIRMVLSRTVRVWRRCTRSRVTREPIADGMPVAPGAPGPTRPAPAPALGRLRLGRAPDPGRPRSASAPGRRPSRPPPRRRSWSRPRRRPGPGRPR